ncbi:MAG: hypothetical protein R3C03_23260 [Pirellulaceae bacterium]
MSSFSRIVSLKLFYALLVLFAIAGCETEKNSKTTLPIQVVDFADGLQALEKLHVAMIEKEMTLELETQSQSHDHDVSHSHGHSESSVHTFRVPEAYQDLLSWFPTIVADSDLPRGDWESAVAVIEEIETVLITSITSGDTFEEQCNAYESHRTQLDVCFEKLKAVESQILESTNHQ